MRKIALVVLLAVLLGSTPCHASRLSDLIRDFAKNGENLTSRWVEAENWLKNNRSAYKDQKLYVELMKSDIRLAVVLHTLMYEKFANAEMFLNNENYSFFVSEGESFASVTYPQTLEFAELHFKLLAKHFSSDYLSSYCSSTRMRLEESRVISSDIATELQRVISKSK